MLQQLSWLLVQCLFSAMLVRACICGQQIDFTVMQVGADVLKGAIYSWCKTVQLRLPPLMLQILRFGRHAVQQRLPENGQNRKGTGRAAGSSLISGSLDVHITIWKRLHETSPLL